MITNMFILFEKIYHFIENLFIREKNTCIKFVFTLEKLITIQYYFLITHLEEIKNLYNLKRISISKYLDSIYNFYCNKSSIEYKPIFKNKKILNLNENIINILEKNYLLFPHIIKNEDDYIYI